jgi:hypothetical protein
MVNRTTITDTSTASVNVNSINLTLSRLDPDPIQDLTPDLGSVVEECDDYP